MVETRRKIFRVIFVLSFSVFIISNSCFAQSSGGNSSAEPAMAISAEKNVIPPSKGDFSIMENVTLDFKDAEIRNVLKILAQKSGVNIVATPDVVGTVTIKLNDVPWDRAMDIILKSNGFGYQRQGNVILVTKIENMSKIQSEEPLKTEIIDLKFLEAQDAMRVLIPMLSPRGKISVLYTKGQKGWKFGTYKIGKEQFELGIPTREAESGKSEIVSVERNPAGQIVTTKMEIEPSIKSKTIIVTDTDSVIDRMKTLILPQVDRKPKQVLVEARIMEVNKDRLRDLGFDYGTGATGAESAGGFSMNTLNKGSSSGTQLGGSLLNSQLSPSNFGAKNGASGTEPFNAGLELLFKKVTGKQFEVMIHALEEDVHSNTLSAPRIVTLDNQEASMFVGYFTPILKSDVAEDSTTGKAVLTQTQDYYQPIGIKLNVVPQVSEEGYINMIIHPSISSSASSVPASSIVGNTTVTTNYPIIDVREAQTQILMRDGETVVIGGLLKDVQTKSITGVPFLSKIPFLGALFRRETNDTGKVDLLIFITAHVVRDDEFTPEEIAKIENRLKQVTEKPVKQKKVKN